MAREVYEKPLQEFSRVRRPLSESVFYPQFLVKVSERETLTKHHEFSREQNYKLMGLFFTKQNLLSFPISVRCLFFDYRRLSLQVFALKPS